MANFKATIGIVFTFNQTDYAFACLESIYRQSIIGDLQVILVNNNCTGALASQLQVFARKPNTKIITNRHNTGYAAACNQVLHEAEGQYIIFPHSDTILTSFTIERLLEQMIRTQSQIGLPLTNYANESFCCVLPIRRQFEKIKPSNKTFLGKQLILQQLRTLYPTGLDTFANQLLTENKNNPSTPIEQISSYCLCFETEFLKQVPFDQRFIHRGNEEKEMWLRARSLKPRMILVRTSYIHHHGNLSTDGGHLRFPQVMQQHDQILAEILSKARQPAQSPIEQLTEHQVTPLLEVQNDLGEINTGVRGTVTKLEKSKQYLPIVHVANLSNFDKAPRLKKAQDLFLESIYTSLTPDVKLVAGVRETCVFDKFDIIELNRDAVTEFNETKNFAFLKDLLDLAAMNARTDDTWLLYINSDCCLSPTLYKYLHTYDKERYVEYFRLDVYNEPTTLSEVFAYPNKILDIGIDGIAIQKKTYLQIRDLIPDFVIGQPHWDTYLSVLLRQLFPPSQNYSDLYHPWHPQAWDFATLPTSGKRNVEMFDQQIVAGIIPKDKYVEKVELERDTAVIVPWFGNDKARIQATIEAFNNLYDFQTLGVHYYFVELLFDNNETKFLDFTEEKHVTHVVLHGRPENDNLFQKEALFNIGGELASKNYKYLIFLDSDIYSPQCNWFADIRNHLIYDPDAVIQGFETCTDSVDPQYRFASWAFGHKNNQASSLLANPGICWAMTSYKFLELKGFNPYAILGCGDGLFAAELVGDETNHPFFYVHSYKQFRIIKRKHKDVTINISYTTQRLIHAHHGYAKDRKYNLIQAASMFYSKPITELVALDHQKLLAWTNPNHREQILLKNLHHAESINDFPSLLNEFTLLPTDLAVITTVYGSRAELAKFAVERWTQQQLKAQIIVVELVFDQEEPKFNFKHPRVLHHIVRGNESNKVVCQKEALNNIGATLLKPSIKYLFFSDNDVYSLNDQWFTRIRNKLIENNDHVIQGYESVIDTIDPDYQFLSFISHKLKQGSLAQTNPGICWALTREKFEKFGGFNPFFVEYSGDSGFAAEILNTDQRIYESYILDFPRFVEILRNDTVKGIPSYIDEELVHLHHGYFRDRSYNARKYIVHRWNKPVRSIVELDSNGLIAWLDNNCVERLSLLNVPHLDDFSEVDQFYAMNDYQCRPNSTMELLKEKIVDTHTSLAVFTNKDNVITLFAPTDLNLQKVEFSWCSNCLHSVEERIGLSEKDRRHGTLAALIAPADSTKMAIVAFPFKRNWGCSTIIDPARKHIEFNIKIETNEDVRCTLQFESLTSRTENVRSNEVALVVPPNEWYKQQYPLKDFINEQFQFERTRLAIFTLYPASNTTVYLNTIKIVKTDA